MAGGYKAATDPAAFSVVGGKLYLNYNRDVQKQWNADVPGSSPRPIGSGLRSRSRPRSSTRRAGDCP
jgi:hypothetical protein